MKKVLLVLSIGVLLTACSSNKDIYSQRAAAERERQEAAVDRVLDQMPKWFVEVPKSKDALYAAGDGVSGSLSGALGNARANAFETICQSAGGTVRSQTKVFRTDTEKSSQSVTTTAIRNMCPDVDVTGAEIKDHKIIRDGNRYRAYVLVALPLGDANVLARTKESDRLARGAMSERDKAFKELDAVVKQ
jgi:predicted acyltransferase (DUF342 family)